MINSQSLLPSQDCFHIVALSHSLAVAHSWKLYRRGKKTALIFPPKFDLSLLAILRGAIALND